MLVGAVTAASLFPRLFGESGEVLERRILGDRFEYHDRIREFIASLQWFTDADVLLDEFNDLMTKTIRAERYQIILRDDSARAFKLLRAYPADGTLEMPELTSDSPVFRFFEVTGAEYLSSHFLYAMPGTAEVEKKAQGFLQHFRAMFCVPLITSEGPFGVLLVGEKADHVPYTATDLSLLVSLARNMSLIINQIRLKNQVLQAQEIELMGRMSRGMAHDLNNLVTPIQTLLQLINEGIPTEDVRDELLPVALRSVDTLREYVREALFFSQNSRPDFRLGRLDVLLLESAEIVGAALREKGLEGSGERSQRGAAGDGQVAHQAHGHQRTLQRRRRLAGRGLHHHRSRAASRRSRKTANGCGCA